MRREFLYECDFDFLEMIGELRMIEEIINSKLKQGK